MYNLQLWWKKCLNCKKMQLPFYFLFCGGKTTPQKNRIVRYKITNPREKRPNCQIKKSPFLFRSKKQFKKKKIVRFKLRILGKILRNCKKKSLNCERKSHNYHFSYSVAETTTITKNRIARRKKKIRIARCKVEIKTWQKPELWDKKPKLPLFFFIPWQNQASISHRPTLSCTDASESSPGIISGQSEPHPAGVWAPSRSAILSSSRCRTSWQWIQAAFHTCRALELEHACALTSWKCSGENSSNLCR